MTIVRQGNDDYYVVTAGAAQAYDHDYLVKMAEDKPRRSGLDRGLRRDRANTASSPLPARNRANCCARWSSTRILRPRCPTSASPGCPPGRLDLKMCPTDCDPCCLYRRIGMGIAPSNRDADLSVRPTDGGGRDRCRPEAGRRPRPELAASGEILSRLWLGSWAAMRAPLESGLDRFVDLSKDFKGKPAMEALGIRAKCVTVLIDGPTTVTHGAARLWCWTVRRSGD